MSVLSQVVGLPGVRAAKTALHRLVFRGGYIADVFPQGRLFQSGKSRDPGNGITGVLRPGNLVGKVTATGKYAMSIIGVTQGAYTSGGTSITVTAAQAAEIVRRVGTSGNLNFIGPPAANGTVATIQQAFSAVNTSTGVITITSLGANLVAGAFVADTDGSQVPVTVIPDGFGVRVTDYDGNDLDVPFPEVPISGVIDTTQILPGYPTDTSLQAWIKTNLSTLSGGKFTFTDAL